MYDARASTAYLWDSGIPDHKDPNRARDAQGGGADPVLEAIRARKDATRRRLMELLPTICRHQPAETRFDPEREQAVGGLGVRVVGPHQHQW